MKSFAQAYQDLFVIAMLNGRRDGTYMDIGCFVPKEANNTYLLDTEYGWNGISIDRHNFNFRSEPRRGAFIECDATTPYPIEAFDAKNKISPSGKFDYLSLDVDEDTNNALLPALVFADYQIITIEHDLYARGVENQERQRRILRDRGYCLLVPNVHMPKQPELVFEDWWCVRDLANGKPSFTPEGNDASDVVSKLWFMAFNEGLPI